MVGTMGWADDDSGLREGGRDGYVGCALAEGRFACSGGCGGAVAGRGDVEEGVVVVAGAGDPGDAHFLFFGYAGSE